MGLFSFFDKNERKVGKYRRNAEAINALEQEYEKLTDEQLKEKTAEFQKRFNDGESLDDMLVEAFAVVREAGKRTLGQRAFDVQLMGGMALHEGNIAEMKTGEGKTLTATFPLYLNGLTGKGCHLATHNDYLARRDATWMGKIYQFLGLTVGFIQAGMEDTDRQAAYAADITYGTANEFGFDYLRDNLVYEKNRKSQRSHYFSIVDEADSILIDEARTPLIISGPSDTPSELYKRFAILSRKFDRDVDFVMDEKHKTMSLTEEGIVKIEKLLNIENLYSPENVKYAFYLTNALRAENFFKLDKDYIIQDDEIVIVDEFTGRLLAGRRYSEGLHQSIEAKEGVKVKQESITYATVTFQNYFRMYEKLSGMTGTAKTEEDELKSIYKCEVVVIPTNRDMVRIDQNDSIYKTQKEKYQAAVKEIKERHAKGQPMLVGTVSIEKSEYISMLLKKEGVPHQVLNAKYHEKEAEIVSHAGEKGMVTIATNMAGRGTDIKLGEGVKELGGLYVIGTERHESRRIDNQLVGRSGRQGDPGESRFFLSFEDDLLRVFGGDKVKNMMDTLKVEEGQSIEFGILTKVIRDSQKKIEGINFSIRKRLFEFDSVVDAQRTSIYRFRDWVLEMKDYDEHLTEIFEDVADRIVEEVWDDKEQILDKKAIQEKLLSFMIVAEIKSDSVEEVKEQVKNLLISKYEEKKDEFGAEEFTKITKYMILRIIDEKWRRCLDSIDAIKESVNLRAYGQKDPVLEFKKESFIMFQMLVDDIYDETTSTLMRIVKVNTTKEEELAKKEAAKLKFIHDLNVAAEGDGKDKEDKEKKGKKKFKVIK